jgi:cell division protein FtsW
MPYHIILTATVALLLLGLVIVTSASSVYAYQRTGSSYSIALKQALYGGIGVLGLYYASSAKVATIRRLATPYFLICLAALGAVLVIGTSVNGQRNWIELFGPFNLQPSEFAKLGVILWGSHVLAGKYHLLEQVRELLVPVGPMFALVLGLVLLEGDLGTAMVIAPVMASLLFFVGAPGRWFAGAAVVSLGGIAALTVAAPYRMTRFTSWLNPHADPEGTGYQVVHGLLALGSGGINGRGLGASREKWGTLPEAHTDFIFAVLGEETGLFGTLMVLVLFTAIVLMALRVARMSQDRFVQLASFGIGTWMATQMVVNIGAVLQVLPVTGVPLPLVSYGGSSLIPSLVAMGILMSFAKSTAAR